MKAPARRKVRVLTAQGLTPREIAGALNVSVQRIYTILSEIRREDEGAA